MSTPPVPVDDSERVDDLRRLDLLLTEPEAALDRVTSELARIFEVPGAYISFIDEDTQYYKSAYGALPEPFAGTRKEPREVSLCSYVVGMNDELIVEDLLADERFRDNPAVREQGARFYAGAPLRADSGRAVGSMCVVDTKPRRVTERERALLGLVADGAMAMVKLQAASRQVLQRTRQIEEDLHQAVRVQRFLLPPGRVEGEGWRIEHRYRPVAHLGGDFVDVLERPDGRVAVIVADVSGHGTSAALTTTMARTAFRRAAPWAGAPGQVLDSMNRELTEAMPPGQFITALTALFAPGARQVSFASAGHPYPLRIGAGGGAAGAGSGAGGPAELIEHRNELPLCVDARASYHGQTDVTLSPGERLLVYTDGAIEAEDPAGRMLGVNGLAELAADAARAAERDGSSILDGVLGGLQAYASNGLGDDVALVCVGVG